ncbi:MAG: arylsulfatase [Planctomycetota bacterium]|nr:arylsulfatase [Planctomycetota bacterium]
MVPRFLFCSLVGLAVIDCGSVPSGFASQAGRPSNIIFIMVDDLGYGDLGCYGQKVIRTPNIDRLAAEGMRFTDFYAGSTVCAPSRCVLMTGLHTGHCYIRGNGKVNIRPDDVTVAEVVKKSGYATGLCGKWGLGHEGSDGLPTRQGFDLFYGYLDQHHAHNYYPTFLVRNEQRVPLKNVVPQEGGWGQGVATKKVEYSHDLIMNEALQFVSDNKNKPFFLYLALTIPHANNEAGNKGMEVPDLGIYAERDWPAPQKGHAAMITYMDRDIGRLAEKLKQLGIDNDTLVMFTSDNGPHSEGGGKSAFFDSNGPLRGQKRDLYEGGIRVPLIARWPGRVKAGSTSSHIGGFWDVLQTCAELADAEPPSGLDGISFAPTLLGKGNQQQHEYIYWEFFERGGKQAARHGKWKAVLNFGKATELYDLSRDIGEKNNLAADHAGVVAKLEGYMKSARTNSELWKLPAAKKRGPK